MFATIFTKFVGPTNARQSRIIAKATNAAGVTQRVTINYFHGASLAANHKEAAARFREVFMPDFAERGEWIAGDMPDGYAFVFLQDDGHKAMLAALKEAEAFISGFEDDDMQDVDALLIQTRKAIALAEA